MQQIPQFTKSLDSASLSMEQIPKKKEQRADKICCGLYFSPGLDNLEKALFILKKTFYTNQLVQLIMCCLEPNLVLYKTFIGEKGPIWVEQSPLD